ncbi:MAG: hypothetical protein R2715_15060 [Ilumatobacteraceae bacterium]
MTSARRTLAGDEGRERAQGSSPVPAPVPGTSEVERIDLDDAEHCVIACSPCSCRCDRRPEAR